MKFTKQFASIFAALIAVSAITLTPAQVFGRQKTPPKFTNFCEYYLTRDQQTRDEETKRVAEEFNNREFHYLGAHKGFSLARRADVFEQAQTPARIITVRSQPRDYNQARFSEVWTSHDQSYIFMNVGLKSLEPYSDRVNRNVFARLLTEPNEDLVVRYDSARMQTGAHLMWYRWAIHDAVMDIYSQKKPYLTDDDFRRLIYLNRTSQNYDVLALLLPNGANLGVKKRVMLTIQISYFGDRHYFRPSLKELIGRDTAYDNDLLPFEYRIPLPQLPDFRHQFYSRFPRQYTCEMLRYALMDAHVPQDIRDRFLLRAFQKAKLRGMRYIIAGADRFTERLYRRYGFKIYSELPTDQHSEPEYLLYLRIDSPEFDATIERLGLSAKSINLVSGKPS